MRELDELFGPVPDDLRREIERGDWDDVLTGNGPRIVFVMGRPPGGKTDTLARSGAVHYDTPKPLTKRQRRRQRGRA